MSITFTCLCGKRLKARESSAGRRTQCPRCGEPVGIPLSAGPVAPPSSRKEAADAATAAARVGPAATIPAAILPSASATAKSRHMPSIPEGDQDSTTPRSDSRIGSEQSSAKPYFMNDDALPPPVRKPKPERARKSSVETRGLPAGVSPGAAAEAASQSLAESPEEGLRLRNPPRWYRLVSRGEYRGPAGTYEFGFSLGNAPLVLTLAGLLALTMGVVVLKLPQAMQNSQDLLILVAGTTSVFVVVAAHACSYLNQTILNAALQQGKAIDLDPVRTAKAAVAWTAAVLAGSVFPATGTFLYWLKIGLAEPVDWVILAELIWLTFYWLTASLLSYGMDGELKSLLPQRTFQKAKLIPKAIAIRSLAGAALCAATIAVLTDGLAWIHVEPLVGFAVLGGTFLVSLSLAAVLASSLGRAGIRVIPKVKVEADAKTKAFEQELQASRG